MATKGHPAVQMILPMTEMMGCLRRGVGELERQGGLQFIELLMEEEVGNWSASAASGRAIGRQPIGQ